MSPDGYIAGPNGEYDWIGADPEVDFNATWSQFDTLLMGRRTFELAVQARGEGAFTTFTGVTSIVFSRTLKPQEHPYVTVLPELNADWVRNLKAQSGKDIWLFGGSAPFSTLASSMASRLLSCRCCWARGFHYFPPPYSPAKLRLIRHHVHRSGRVSLAYEVER